MTTYLLPTIRTPNDRAHISSNGAALCGQRLTVAMVESEWLCAMDVCEACEQFAAQWVQVSFIDGVESIAATALNKPQR